jgi:hypothetical protein
MGQIINQYLFFFYYSMTHKSEDYKISAVKYLTKIILEKLVKSLIVRNLHVV